MNSILRKVEKKYLSERQVSFGPGDTVSVSMKIQEGDKSRIQAFQGIVIQRRGAGVSETFTVRKPSSGVYVEKIFPLHSPLISEIKLVRHSKVRRAKLYFLRDRTGKAARLREAK